MKNIIEQIEKKQMTNRFDSYRVGDTVVVSKEIVEGEKRRIQKFEGLIIKVQNARSRQNITVRKIVGKVGVEKTFLVFSHLVKNIEVKQKGKVRRAKLFYLRERKGKRATRVKLR